MSWDWGALEKAALTQYYWFCVRALLAEYGARVVSILYWSSPANVPFLSFYKFDSQLQRCIYCEAQSAVNDVSIVLSGVVSQFRWIFVFLTSLPTHHILDFAHDSIHESCPHCGKPLQGGESITGIARRTCRSCRRRVGMCFLCHEPVKGVFVWCPGCGHGGHLDHALQWFGGMSGKPVREVCPTGCGTWKSNRELILVIRLFFAFSLNVLHVSQFCTVMPSNPIPWQNQDTNAIWCSKSVRFPEQHP